MYSLAVEQTDVVVSVAVGPADGGVVVVVTVAVGGRPARSFRPQDHGPVDMFNWHIASLTLKPLALMGLT